MNIDFQKHHFCTYFDHNFLAQGIALLQSLKTYCPEATVHVLCLSETAYRVLSKLSLKGVSLITLPELELEYPMLAKARENRSLVEYYFTCSPFLPQFVLKKEPGLQFVTYLDADLFFFSSPQELLCEVEKFDLSIVEHRFAEHREDFEKLFGKFNVAWLTFKNSDNSLACLSQWSQQCVDSCSQEAEKAYGDQKYLDTWPEQFGAHVLDRKGANLAPWNCSQYVLGRQGGEVMVDEDRLVFFHFSGLRKVRAGLYDLGTSRFSLSASRILKKYIYGRYVEHLTEVGRLLRAREEDCQILVNSARDSGARPYRFPFHKMLRKLREIYLDTLHVLKGYYLIRIFGYYF